MLKYTLLVDVQNILMSVRSNIIWHPKKGVKKLVRRGVNLIEFERIASQPRVHTGERSVYLKNTIVQPASKEPQMLSSTEAT